MSKTEMTASTLTHPALNFFYTYITAKESHFFWVSSVQAVTFCKFVGKQEKSLLSPCVLAVSCVSLWASCHCWERVHSHVSHSRCFVLLVWSHSVLMSLSVLFPFFTSTPCHPTSTTSTYRWESQSALCSLSVLHFATAALVSKYTPWFFVQTTLQFISSLLSSLAICYFSCYFSYLQKKKKRKQMWCVINPCSFPMEPLVKYCSFFTFWYFILHIADFRV